jgi:hypothetical protein
MDSFLNDQRHALKEFSATRQVFHIGIGKETAASFIGSE